MSFVSRPEKHSPFSPSISGSMEEWQCVISDPAVPISAPTPQSLPTCDDQVSDSNMSGRKYPDVREAWMPDRSGNVLASTMVASEDAVNQTIPRFSDDQWNYIFMKSEPGNDLDFSPAEAPMVNTVNAQEAFGPSPLEPNMENLMIRYSICYRTTYATDIRFRELEAKINQMNEPHNARINEIERLHDSQILLYKTHGLMAIKGVGDEVGRLRDRVAQVESALIKRCQKVHASCHYSKRADRHKGVKDASTTNSMDHLSHSTTMCTSTYQTLPTYGHPPYDPAMSGQNILGVPETMNSCYVPDFMPSFVLPELRLEENQMKAQFEAQLEKDAVEINQMQTEFKAQIIRNQRNC
ncbi:Hypothetical protein PENO1_111730 [Penicillium occitanis (nom. inval.)]|nr:Hypothetical protein PENO1_111730 [Penicillium occitanis (nom. inval.)]PCG88224.1 hypothetical protein PENOC_111990 [Penicillium occitanis (nom. inval.)]